MTENFKRTYQLREILNESWFKNSPNSCVDDTGNSLLHVATLLSETKLVTVICHFFQTIIDINTTNNDGNTALHLSAMLSEGANVTETILKHGGKMTKNKKGLTPLQLAAKG